MMMWTHLRLEGSACLSERASSRGDGKNCKEQRQRLFAFGVIPRWGSPHLTLSGRGETLYLSLLDATFRCRITEQDPVCTYVLTTINPKISQPSTNDNVSLHTGGCSEINLEVPANVEKYHMHPWVRI